MNVRGSKTTAWRSGAVVLLAATLLCVALAAPALAADRWSDISDAQWVTDYNITAAQAATVADGRPDGSFHPYEPVTRGQFSKMAVNGLGLETASPAQPTFVDVPAGHTFFAYVEGAYAAELIRGYIQNGVSSFRPGETISRQQANSILGRYLSNVELAANGSIKGLTLTYPSLAAWYKAEGQFNLGKFDDEAQILPDHRPGTAYLAYRKVVLGSQSGGKLLAYPSASLWRAPAVALVLRVFAAADAVSTPPPAPVDLAVMPLSPSSNPRPVITGKTISGGRVLLYDTFGGQTVELAGATGVAQADGSFSIQVPALAEGMHSIRAKVKSPAGQMSFDFSAPVAYLYDSTAPSGQIVQPAAGGGVRFRKPVFTVAATDGGAGILAVTFQYRAKGATEYVTVSTDGTQPYEAIWGDISLPDGGYELRALVFDKAGNELVLGPQALVVDLLSPLVEVQAPAAAGVFYTEEPAPLFAAAASDPIPAPGAETSGVAKVEFLYRLKSELPADAESWTADDFSLLGEDDSPGYSADPAAWGPGLADGRYIFAVRALDRAGNASLLDWQEVVLDRQPPELAITAPVSEQMLSDNTPFLISWTLTDVAGVDTVKIEYSPNAGDSWETLATAAANTGSFEWLVPDVVGERTFRVRITATDRAGVPLEDVAGHTRVISTGNFLVIEPPQPAVDLVASDPDLVDAGLSGLDFKLEWTPSASEDVVAQLIYLLPQGVTIDTSEQDPVATLGEPGVSSWTGSDALIADSRGDPFDPALSYELHVVTRDSAGTQTGSGPALWPAVLPAAPTALEALDQDLNPGVDGRDITVSWTPSVSAGVVAQHVYVLPQGVALVLTGPEAHGPVATIAGNLTAQWTGTSALTSDSAMDALASGAYRAYIVAESEDGRRQPSAGAALTVVAP